MLEGCLGTISTECLARGLIGHEAYEQTTFAGARHTNHYIREILSAIGVKIKEDPENLKVFVDDVLATMGGFTDTLVTQLSECGMFLMEGIMSVAVSPPFCRNMKSRVRR